jgi:hypothetical protein
MDEFLTGLTARKPTTLLATDPERCPQVTGTRRFHYRSGQSRFRQKMSQTPTLAVVVVAFCRQ